MIDVFGSKMLLKIKLFLLLQLVRFIKQIFHFSETISQNTNHQNRNCVPFWQKITVTLEFRKKDKSLSSRMIINILMEIFLSD